MCLSESLPYRLSNTGQRLKLLGRCEAHSCLEIESKTGSHLLFLVRPQPHTRDWAILDSLLQSVKMEGNQGGVRKGCCLPDNGSKMMAWNKAEPWDEITLKEEARGISGSKTTWADKVGMSTLRQAEARKERQAVSSRRGLRRRASLWSLPRKELVLTQFTWAWWWRGSWEHWTKVAWKWMGGNWVRGISISPQQIHSVNTFISSLRANLSALCTLFPFFLKTSQWVGLLVSSFWILGNWERGYSICPKSHGWQVFLQEFGARFHVTPGILS